MYETNYHRPATLEQAAALLAANPDAKLLAGGQTLLPTMKQRLAAPSDLIDIGRLEELRFVRHEGGVLSIGAGIRHAEVARDETVRRVIPGLAGLAGEIGDPQVRNMGTIGGSVANNDPAADYPAAVLALAATIHTTQRAIPADDFFTGMFETALEENEILTRIDFPVPERAAYAKFRNPASRYAMAGVFVAKSASGVRVAVTGAGPSVFRVAEMEQALSARFSPDALAGIAVSPEGLNSDIHGAADYRAHLVAVMARKAVEKALA